MRVLISNPTAPVLPGARTPLTGFAKVNGTPTVLTVQIPNDGQTHPVLVTYQKLTTVAETQGAMRVNYTLNGSANFLPGLDAGGAGIGTQNANASIEADPGTTVTLAQTSALTAGASTVFASISVLA